VKVLEYTDPLVSEFYLYENKKKVKRVQGVEYREPTIKNLHNFFYITIPKNSKITFHIHINTNYSSTYGKFKLIDKEMFFKEQDFQFLLLTVFFTTILVLVIYNFLIYIFSRDKIYFNYALMFFSSVFMYSIAEGYFYTYLEPSTREYFENDIFSMILINGVLITYILFIKEFLNTKQYKKVDLSLNILLVVFVLVIFLLSVKRNPKVHQYAVQKCTT